MKNSSSQVMQGDKGYQPKTVRHTRVGNRDHLAIKKPDQIAVEVAVGASNG